MKKIMNFLPVAAILLASGLAVATTQKVPAQNYYRDPISGLWTPLGDLEPGDQEGQYQCNQPEDNMCTSESLSGQTPGGHIDYGEFKIVGQ